MARPNGENISLLIPLRLLFRPFRPDMRPLLINTLLFITSLVLWVLLALFHFADGLPDTGLGGLKSLNTPTYRVVLVAFLITQTAFWARVFTRQEKFDVVERLWRLFSVGMLCVSAVLVVVFGERLTGVMIMRPYLMGFLFVLGLYAFTVFFVGSVFTYQRFILYPRTPKKSRAWNTYLALLVAGLLFIFFEKVQFTLAFRLAAYIALAVIMLYLVVQLRWVSYLNFTQKLQAAGLFLLILLIQASLLFAAYLMPAKLGIRYHENFGLEFFHFLVALSVGYSISSLLVLFFSLPTSSLFEQRSYELASFNKINHAIQSNLDFSDIMDTLLSICLYTSDARGGWVEVWDESEGVSKVQISKKLTLEELHEVRPGPEVIRKLLREKEYLLVRNLRRNREFRRLSSRFRSLLAVPVYSGGDGYGVVILVAEAANGFEEFTIQLVKAYAEQTAVSLENARLVSQSIENERFREQFKLAKELQESLLPVSLPQSEAIEFAAQAQSAYEVGGDYYDVVEVSPTLFRVAIGDVSGKGAKAAFYMAEVKGIFQSLSRLQMEVTEFISHANQAVSACLPRGQFVTMTYLEINTETRTVKLIRAGHCPAFLMRASGGAPVPLREGGLGLGILSDQRFDESIADPCSISYQPGDTLLLYTDGIPEARNHAGEEFGYARIEAVLIEGKKMSAPDLVGRLMLQVQQFAQADIHDDFTVLAIRFKDPT